MAKKKITKPEEQKAQAKCMTCSYAKLMQWDKNPIIAHCTCTNQREVAAAYRLCANYEQAKSLPKPIEHFKRYFG